MTSALFDPAAAPRDEVSRHALRRLGQRLAQVPDARWSPPPLTDLIARIDGALAARRAA